jgi:hypothetical protein
MRDIRRWGILIGVVAAAVALIGQLLSSSKGVSLFPDALSLLTLVAMSALALRQVLHDALNWGVVVRRATALGATAGVIVGAAALVRGLLLWSSPNIWFAAVVLLTSLVEIIVVMNVIALASFYGQRKAARIGV